MKYSLLKHNDYLSKSMITYIKKTKLVYYKKNINFAFFGYSLKKNKYYPLYYKKIQLLYKDIFNDFNIQIKFLNIVIIDCPQHRYFIDHKYFINGGFTYLNNNIVYIYRNDEALKVILHEIIHHCFYFKTTAIFLGDPLRNKVIIDFNEAIVEFLATLYFIKYNNINIQNQLKHSFNNIKNVISMPNKKFNTNIYSYIIITYLLLKKYKTILKYIKNKHYDKIYQYVYNIKINIKPIKINNNSKLKFIYS